MEEADEYVPQISQIDYNLIDNGNGVNRQPPNPYYNMGQLPDMYGHDQQRQTHPVPPHPQSSYMGLTPQGYPQHPPGHVPPQQQVPPSAALPTPPPKKRGGRKKAAAANNNESSFPPPQQQQQQAPHPSQMCPPNYPMPSHAGMRPQAPGNYNYYNNYPQNYPQMPQGQQYPKYPMQTPYGQPGYNMGPTPQGYYPPNMQQPHQQQQQQQAPRPQFYNQQGQFMNYPSNPQQPPQPPQQQQQQQQPQQQHRYPQMGQQNFYPDPNGFNPGYMPGYSQQQASQPPQQMQQNKPAHLPNSQIHSTGPHTSTSQPQPSFSQPNAQATPTQQTPRISPYPQPTSMPNTQRNMYNGLQQQQQQQQFFSQHSPNLPNAQMLQQLQQNICEVERQLQYIQQQQPTPELNAKREQLFMSLSQMKGQLHHIQAQQQQQQSQTPQSLTPGQMPPAQPQKQQPMMPPGSHHQQPPGQPGLPIQSNQPPIQHQQPPQSSQMTHSQPQNPMGMPSTSKPNYPAPPEQKPPNLMMPTVSQRQPTPPMQQVLPPPLPPSVQTNSSVPLMQTSAGQVQVNITPEAAGRTLISVYQYPPQNSTPAVSDSMSHNNAVTNITNEQSLSHQPAPNNMQVPPTLNTHNNGMMKEPTVTTVPQTFGSVNTDTVVKAPIFSPVTPQPPSLPIEPKVEPVVPSPAEIPVASTVPTLEPQVEAQSSPTYASPEIKEEPRLDNGDQNGHKVEEEIHEEKKTEVELEEAPEIKPQVQEEEREEQPEEVEKVAEPEKIEATPESVETSEIFNKEPADDECEKQMVATESVTINIEEPKKIKKTPAKAKKVPKQTSSVVRKRKKPNSDVSSDEDTDFVVETKKKKAKGQSNGYVEPVEAPPENLQDFIETRRSGRTKGERKYDEKMEIDDELDEVMPPPALALEETPPPNSAAEFVVEKILGIRERSIEKTTPKAEEEKEKEVEEKNEKSPSFETSEEAKKDEDKEDTDNVDTDTVQEDSQPSSESSEEDREEYYVKFKNKSYLHCEWKTFKELEALDKRIAGKINRFKAKVVDENEYFNPDFTIVDRVLDEAFDDETQSNIYLVKWKSLQYEESTWESADIVPQSKIDFWRQSNEMDTYKQKETARPEPGEWEKITSTKEYKDGNKLRDYQVEGVSWLLFCYYNQQNCILADEMGLGKTVQTITFLQGVYDLNIHGPFLVVVPLSTLPNWEREFETWTNMNTVVYYGSAISREMIQNYEMYYPRTDSKKKNIAKFDVLLTTFEMVISDVEILRKVNYRVCVIDEAHRLKNRNSKLLTGGLLSFKLEHRVLLTGTPLQNNIQELFSLLNFLEPEQFHSSDNFLEQFGQCQTEEQVQQLQAILKPMMLRRLKEDVEKSLQPKEETIIEVQLSNIQKKYYRAILERNFTHLLKGTVPSLMNTMMELRKCCNHPFLIKGAEDQIVAELKQQHREKSDDELNFMALVQSSGKVVLIDKLLPKLKQDGHKVLIFSQMVKVLDLLEEFLNHKNYPCERIDGNIRGDMRQAAIDRFSKKDSEKFVFLLCTRAGGLGINLTAADTVIIFDSDWNPQNDLQAQARCHRIGQTKMVKVYRLITTNTYEREMFDKASLKLGLDKAVLQSMTPKDSNQQLSRKEVEELLRKGAYGAVMDEDNEGSKFSEEDIDTILSRRTQTIKLEPGVKGSTFAKASFTSSSNREDIDVNDPNFWSKWAKKANVDVDMEKNELILSEPRNRRKRFEETYKGLHEGESDGDDASEGRKSADFSKSRSGKKRRRGDDDDDYVGNAAPDELSFNKSEYFKIEKLLNMWGWGRWAEIKEHSDLSLSFSDIEHIARTLLLHCIREYKGDEKTKDFVYHLIAPDGAVSVKSDKKSGAGLYTDGWARKPEYNPPSFAIDMSFTRHIHRHAHKLLQRMFHFFLLHNHLIVKEEAEKIQAGKELSEINLNIPSVGDPPLAVWDAECDKSFIVGIYKHGMENYEAIRGDENLCFISKGIEEMPSTLELNTRFKRIMLMVSKQVELSLTSQNIPHSKWPKNEENDFMRVLRVYGVKDDNEGNKVINWVRFRELSTHLHNKTDAEMLEQLYCVLAMCTKEQGGDLSVLDQKRAGMVDKIPRAKAEKLMNRLHLMRKIHAIITTGMSNVKVSLKLCSTDTMYSGWEESHDEKLLHVVDEHGLENIVPKLSKLPLFEKFTGKLEEKELLRRVVEICTTLETGKWNGKATVDLIDDEASTSSLEEQAAMLLLQNFMASTTQPSVRTPSSSSQKKAVKKKASTAASSSTSQPSLNDMNYLMQMLGMGTGQGTSSASQIQQLNMIAQMYTMMMNSNDANSKQLTNLLMSMMGGDALNLTSTGASTSSKPPAKASSSTAAATPSSSKPKEAASTSSATPSTSSQIDPNMVSMTDLLKYLQYPPESPVPVINSSTQERLTGSKAPTLANLDSWLASHPKFRVDTDALIGATADTTKKPSTAIKTEPSTPKPSSSQVDDPVIGVLNKTSGTVLAKEKWPKLSELASWLDRHPDMNVQESFTKQIIDKLPSQYHQRVGVEKPPTTSAASTSSQDQAALTAALEQTLLQSLGLSNSTSAASSLENMQMQYMLQQLMMTSSLPASYQNQYLQMLTQSPQLATAAAAAAATSNANEAALIQAMFSLPQASTSMTTRTPAPKVTVPSTPTTVAPATTSNANSLDLLATELMSNPQLMASLMTTDAATLQALGLSSLTGGVDLNAALQMSLLGSSLGTTATQKPQTPTTSAPKKPTTTSSSGRSGKSLSAVVEKLASSSQNNG